MPTLRFALLAALVLAAPIARAETAKVSIAHYGRLLNADDTFADGNHKFLVRLYTEKVAGSSIDAKVWEDTFTNVPVSKGLFHLDLGSGAALDASIFAGRPALYVTVTVDDGVEMSPRLAVGRVPLAAQADRATVADGVRWSGGVVQPNEQGKWPAASLDIPSNLATLLNGKLDPAQLPGNVVVADANGRIPLAALPSGPSGLDAASLGGHTPSDAQSGDKAIALLANGKLPESALPANVPLLQGGKLGDSLLSANVPLLVGGRVPETILPATVALLADGKLPEAALPVNVPLLTAGRLAAGTLPTGVAFTGQDAAFSSLNVGGVANAKAQLSVKGALRIGFNNEACDATTNGTLRFHNERLEICANSTWVLVASAPASGTTIQNAGGTRRWSDGSQAKSCKDYRNPTAANFSYAGDTGNGVYEIKPAGTVLKVYCDMATDGGGWTATFKWKSQGIPYPSGTNNVDYFPQLVTSFDTEIARPDAAPTGNSEGLSSAARLSTWTQSGATTYRMTAYDTNNGIVADVKKNTNLDVGNTSYCAAAGVGCGNAYSNGYPGTVHVLGGSAVTAGATPALYQWGHYGCNCWEGQFIGGDSGSGVRLFGDSYSTSSQANTSYTVFWVR